MQPYHAASLQSSRSKRAGCWLLSSGFGVEGGKAQFSGLPPKADFPILELTPAASSWQMLSSRPRASPRSRVWACGTSWCPNASSAEVSSAFHLEYDSDASDADIRTSCP